MHGQYCEERQQQWHMRPGPSQRPDSSSVKCFSKAGHKVGVGDFALFQAGNCPPFIGIIRKLTGEEEGNLKLGVNWLYRPRDIKLGKGVSLEAAPNEIFYSFHKDEISAASLLHPCKIAFLQKGVELPSGVSSYVCRRVYDIPKRCLYWLTDQDYTKEHQDEVDQLLDRTKREMQAAFQSGVSSQRASSQQQKADSVLNAALPGQGKGKKRERTDQSVEPCKRERSMKTEDGDVANSKQECGMKLEDIASIADKDGGLSNMPEVDQLVHVMLDEQSDTSRNPVDVASRRSLLASIVAATEREDCLTRFVQLGGLSVLHDWLQEAHKGRIGDSGSPKEGDKALDELLLTLLQALDKLPVDLDALKTSKVGKSVNNLKSHKNSEIQKRARKLVVTWKKRVKVEMKSSGESKSGSNSGTPWSCKQPSNESHWTKGRSTSEVVSIKSTAVVKSVGNGSCLGDMKCSSVSVGGCKDPPLLPSSTNPKDPVKSHGSGTSEGHVKEEKSSSSSQSQNNSQSWCSGSVKGARSWKEEMKTSSAISTGTKTTLRSHTNSGKCRQAASLTGAKQDLAGGKHSNWNRRPGHEKVTRSTSMEKGAAESVRAENSNNQRLIVRLPNPGRSPARTASGGSLADGGTSASRGSSPGSSERHDSVDGKSKPVSSAPAVHSPDTSRDTNGNYSAVKSGADCIGAKERPCVASADDTDFQSSDAEHKPKETEPSSNHIIYYSGKCLPDGMQVGVLKKATGASVAHGSSDTTPKVHDLDTKEGGIDLLASIAACEGSEPERSFSEQSPAKDGNREPGKQIMHLNEPPIRNQGEGFLVVSHEDDEKQKKDGLPKLSAKGSPLERVGTERVDPESFPAQQAKGPAYILKEQPGVSTSGKSLEESVANGATESTLISTDSSVKDMNVAAARGTEALFGSQDGCGRVKEIKRETPDEEKGVVSRLSTDICNASSLTGECQTGTVSCLDSAGFMEEGIEDVKKAVTNSPSSLVRMPSVGDVGNAADSISGYYEEDALEVACQVAKEVEQEVERYGKPEAQDVNSISVCKDETSHESPMRENDNCISPCKADAKSKGRDQDRCCRDAVVYSDDSQETVTEKREGMEALRPSAAGEGEEVDQVSPEKSRPVLESGLGSIVDDNSKTDVKEVAILEKFGQSSPVAVLEESVDATVNNVQSTDRPTIDQEGALTIVSNDGTCGSSDASGRLAFDLNEGFVADETLHDDANPSSLSFCNPAGPFHDSPSGTPAVVSSLTAPIAVVAAAKGAFIPPSNLLRSKAELGWKGSAATSAFRPAEPRRATETVQSPSETTGTGAAGDSTGQSGKRPRILDIDLNVADERGMEDVDMVSKFPSQSPVLGMVVHSTVQGSDYHKGSLNESSSSGFYVNSKPVPFRPELDLNKAGETEESMGALGSDIRDAEGSGRSNNNPSRAATPVMRDFDLNDGPCLEECVAEEPPLQHSNVKNLENSALPGPVGMRSNPELVNVASWYPAANSLQTVVMPGFSVGRAESSYPGVPAPTGKNIMNLGHGVTPFNGDLYRAGAVMSSSAAASYATTMPAAFPYSGFQFGSGFPFTSASYNMSSTPFVTSTNSTPYQTAPSQLVSAGAVISPYGRPYLVGLTEFPAAETGASWSRPNLDLNAGPDVVDTDTREEGFGARQMPALGQLSFQQAGSSGGPSKRKEPEGGFDPFRSGFKQMTWQ